MDEGRSNPKSLDAAVLECDAYIKTHRTYARGTLVALLGVVYGVIGIAMFMFVGRSGHLGSFDLDAQTQPSAYSTAAAKDPTTFAQGKAAESSDRSKLDATPSLELLTARLQIIQAEREAQDARKGAAAAVSTAVITGAIALLSVVIAILLSLYRFHLQEISRTEHYKLGFLRIRIAATNVDGGFQSEVRQSLTDGAFSYDSSKRVKKGPIESPLPGHPGSDASALLLNRILDVLATSKDAKPS